MLLHIQAVDSSIAGSLAGQQTLLLPYSRDVQIILPAHLDISQHLMNRKMSRLALTCVVSLKHGSHSARVLTVFATARNGLSPNARMSMASALRFWIEVNSASSAGTPSAPVLVLYPFTVAIPGETACQGSLSSKLLPL